MKKKKNMIKLMALILTAAMLFSYPLSVPAAEENAPSEGEILQTEETIGTDDEAFPETVDPVVLKEEIGDTEASVPSEESADDLLAPDQDGSNREEEKNPDQKEAAAGTADESGFAETGNESDVSAAGDESDAVEAGTGSDTAGKAAESDPAEITAKPETVEVTEPKKEIAVKKEAAAAEKTAVKEETPADNRNAAKNENTELRAAKAAAKTIDDVRAEIQALSADARDYTASDRARVESILADFNALSAADQAILDTEESHSDSSQPLGRILEAALWTVWSFDIPDNSTPLTDKTYDAGTTPALSSVYSKGKSTSGRQKPWSVKEVTVKNGKAYATIAVESTTYSGIMLHGTTYPKTNTSGNCEFANVPIDLNSTFYFNGVSTSMPAPIAFSLTTTIDEADKEEKTVLSVINNVKGLDITEAELGVMSNSGAASLYMTAGDRTFTKFYEGTAAGAEEDPSGAVSLTEDQLFVVSMTGKLGKDLSVSFYSDADEIWHDASMNVEEGQKLTLTEGEKADYSKVEEARKKVPADLSKYKETRVKALQEALAAVKEGLYASQQAKVDAFAKAIEDAIDALEKENVTVTVEACDKKTGKVISGAEITVKDAAGKTVTAQKAGVYSLKDGSYTFKATAQDYEDAVLENYNVSKTETIKLELQPKESLPERTVVFEENTKDPSKTNLFNTTGMFKVVKGTLVNTDKNRTLTISLSGTGYHYLFKGTYEEGLDNGLKKENWIAGTVNSDGKWEFVIPLSKNETFIPIVAISDTHLKKAEAGEEELGKALFARQLVLDPEKITLTAGDYDEMTDITVVSRTDKFKADSKGKMEIVGGPNSNNYANKPQITMQDGLYSKAFIGTAADAARDGAAVIERKNNSFLFELVNSFSSNGRVVMFEDKKPIAVAFFDTDKNEWTDYKLTIDKAARTVTIEALKEDELPPEKPEQPDSSDYQDDSNVQPGVVDNETTLPDGIYTPKSFRFSGGSGKLVITCEKVEIRNGQAYATIHFQKTNGGEASVDTVRANGTEYPGFNTFTIPVKLNANNTIVGRTTAMSQPHWIEYSIFIVLDEPGKKGEDGAGLNENTSDLDEKAPEILGLTAEGETEVEYSDLIKIFNYKDGYYLIEIDAVRDTARDSLEYRTLMELAALETKEPSKTETTEDLAEEEGQTAEESMSELIAAFYQNEVIKYLIIPDGKEVPAGLDKEVIIIHQPADKTYVSSNKAAEMIAALGALSNITTVGMEEEKVEEPALLEAMKKEAGTKGAVIYAGAYDDWDLRTMIKEKTNFAVQSSEILPGDEKTLEEDLENLTRLGQRSAQMDMAMFIDRSTDETTALGEAEWYKVYGVLFGKSEQAEKMYREVVSAATDKEKEEAKAKLKTRADEKKKMKEEAKAAAEKKAKEG
ncbi:MAG: hypothetical protein IKG70_02395 [Lachnospiraceae bacterium]|nr:hypothetical protein [Lachnospiraceae bacterium]